MNGLCAARAVAVSVSGSPAMAAGAAPARHTATTTGRVTRVIDGTTWIDVAPITTEQAVTVPGYHHKTQSGETLEARPAACC